MLGFRVLGLRAFGCMVFRVSGFGLLGWLRFYVGLALGQGFRWAPRVVGPCGCGVLIEGWGLGIEVHGPGLRHKGRRKLQDLQGQVMMRFSTRF